ncbi:zinc finger CCHC domain-containing protein 17-like [Antedon mediterranea]|uniref:zinc finger CCHC domain-containing protein 17-like n=1 Tax=Antedon mediterranea TaxID=105859 RepID=UPI003AF5202D
MSDDRRNNSSRKESTSKLKLYSIFKGEVASVQEYGAFVKIPNHQKNGLVHRSQISYSKVDDAKDVLDVGDKIFCKVISLGEDNDKIGLSMKCVNQGSGVDQDPNHLLTVQDEQRKKSGGGYIKPKIELGAIFNTQCKQCGGQGHIATECFQAPGEKAYELVPEIELPPPPPVAVKTHHKKKKKEKKAKKKKHKHDTSDSDSSSDDEPKRKSKHKKNKKTKSSRKRNYSSSDSDSSSEDELEKRSKEKKRKKSDKRRHSSPDSEDSSSDDKRKKKRKKEKKTHHHDRSNEKHHSHRHQNKYTR